MSVTPPKRRARHLAIAEKLREEVAHLAPGESLPSRQLLRKRFRAGDETICSALSQLKGEGILEERGSRVCVTAIRPERYIAVLSELDISQPGTSYFFLRMIQSLREFFNESGQPHRLYVGRHDPHAFAVPDRLTCDEFVRDARAGRLIAAVTICTRLDLLKASLSDIPFPLITTEQNSNVGWTDYGDMVNQAVDCLVSRNRRRIALIGHRDAGNKRLPPGFAAFESCLERHGIPFHPEWRQSATGFFNSDSGADALRRLWKSREEKPDGLIVLDDGHYYELAPLLLYNHIVVPDDLTVISHATKGNPRPMIPEPMRLEVDPDAFARAVGIAVLRRIDQFSHVSENIPPIMRMIEESVGSRGLAL